jgi:hypothetical protein
MSTWCQGELLCGPGRSRSKNRDGSIVCSDDFEAEPGSFPAETAGCRRAEDKIVRTDGGDRLRRAVRKAHALTRADLRGRQAHFDAPASADHHVALQCPSACAIPCSPGRYPHPGDRDAGISLVAREFEDVATFGGRKLRDSPALRNFRLHMMPQKKLPTPKRCALGVGSLKLGVDGAQRAMYAPRGTHAASGCATDGAASATPSPRSAGCARE